MILMIDNYDSFTYNLVQYLGELKQKVLVKRNDEITLKDITSLKPSHIIISPGPCTPKQAGLSVDIVKQFAGKIPILGVCLGCQSIGYALGGKVVRAKKLMHGKTSLIHHNEQTIFKGIKNPFTATRYHSLVLEKKSLPKHFIITALAKDDKEIMGIRHKTLRFLEGVQFHPESILTEQGHALLKNFINSKL